MWPFFKTDIELVINSIKMDIELCWLISKLTVVLLPLRNGFPTVMFSMSSNWHPPKRTSVYKMEYQNEYRSSCASSHLCLLDFLSYPDAGFVVCCFFFVVFFSCIDWFCVCCFDKEETCTKIGKISQSCQVFVLELLSLSLVWMLVPWLRVLSPEWREALFIHHFHMHWVCRCYVMSPMVWCSCVTVTSIRTAGFV